MQIGDDENADTRRAYVRTDGKQQINDILAPSPSSEME